MKPQSDVLHQEAGPLVQPLRVDIPRLGNDSYP